MSHISMYEIHSTFKHIFAELEENGGELTEEIAERLAINKNDLAEKVNAYNWVIKYSNAELDSIKEEERLLALKKKTISRKIEVFKKISVDAVTLYGVKKVDPKTGSVTYYVEGENGRKATAINAPSLQINDVEKIPDNFKEFVLTSNKLSLNKLDLVLDKVIEINELLGTEFGEVVKPVVSVDSTTLKKAVKEHPEDFIVEVDDEGNATMSAQLQDGYYLRHT